MTALRPWCQNVRNAVFVGSGPEQTLMRGAANGGFEPKVPNAELRANVGFSWCGWAQLINSEPVSSDFSAVPT